MIACFFKLDASKVGSDSVGRIDLCSKTYAWSYLPFPRVSSVPSPCCPFQILIKIRYLIIEQIGNIVDLGMRAARGRNCTSNASRSRLRFGGGRRVRSDSRRSHSRACHPCGHDLFDLHQQFETNVEGDSGEKRDDAGLHPPPHFLILEGVEITTVNPGVFLEQALRFCCIVHRLPRAAF